MPNIWNDYEWLKGPITSFLCPSDPEGRKPCFISGNGRTNYVASLGDTFEGFSETGHCTRGIFSGQKTQGTDTPNWVHFKVTSFASISDGTSNTIMLSEVATADELNSRRVKGGFVSASPATPASCRGYSTDRIVYIPTATVTEVVRAKYCWACGCTASAAFTTVLPPNCPTCLNGNVTNPGSATAGFLPPTSYHPGGVNVCMADATVHFIGDTVNCGDQSYNYTTATNTVRSESNHRVLVGESPFGVWGALGSMNGGENASVVQ